MVLVRLCGVMLRHSDLHFPSVSIVSVD